MYKRLQDPEEVQCYMEGEKTKIPRVWGLHRYWEVHRKEVGTNTEDRGQKRKKEPPWMQP